MSQIESDSSHWVIEVTLCKIQLDRLLIIIRAFKGEFYLHHNGKVWRWYSWLLILLFCQLPVRHHVPYHAALIYWAFFQLRIFVIYNLKKCKELRRNSVSVYSQLNQHFLFYVRKCFIRFSFYQYIAANG